MGTRPCATSHTTIYRIIAESTPGRKIIMLSVLMILLVIHLLTARSPTSLDTAQREFAFSRRVY